MGEKMPRGTIEVQWVDSALDSGWTSVIDAVAKEPIHVRTIGFLIGETPEYIVVASSRHGTDAAGIMRIPKVAILSEQRGR